MARGSGTAAIHSRPAATRSVPGETFGSRVWRGVTDLSPTAVMPDVWSNAAPLFVCGSAEAAPMGRSTDARTKLRFLMSLNSLFCMVASVSLVANPYTHLFWSSKAFDRSN